MYNTSKLGQRHFSTRQGLEACVVSVELGKAQGCSASCRCKKRSRSNVRIGSAEKSLPMGLNSMQLDRLGARVPSPHRFSPNGHAPPKGPVFSTTGSSAPTLVNTLS